MTKMDHVLQEQLYTLDLLRGSKVTWIHLSSLTFPGPALFINRLYALCSTTCKIYVRRFFSLILSIDGVVV